MLVGAALVAALVVVGASYWQKRRHAVPAPPAPAALPAGAHQQLSGYTFTRSEGGRQLFTIHAARTVSFQGGTETSLEDVSVEIFGRAGRRHDLLRTASCQYDSSTGGFRCAGKVEVELNATASSSANLALAPAQLAESKGSGPRHNGGGQQTIYLETAKLSFQPQGAVLSTDAPVRFRYGAWSGRGVGLKYGSKDEWLEVTRAVRLDLPSSDGSAPLSFTAGGLRFTKINGDTGQVELRGPVAVTAGARQVSADRASMLLDGANGVRQAALEGNVSGSETSPGQSLQFSAGDVHAEFAPFSQELRRLTAAGKVQVESKAGSQRGSVAHLAADQLEVNLAGVPPLPQAGMATGDVELSLLSPGAVSTAPTRAALPSDHEPAVALGETQREILTASELRFAFGSEGANLREAATEGAGKLVLAPSDPRAGERVVTAGQFVLAFDSHGHLETFKGLKPTRILFEPGAGSVRSQQSPSGRGPMESSADTLEAKLDPSTESVQTVEQTGNVHIDGQDGQATAERAQYSAPTQTLTLTGDPILGNAATLARADRLVVHLNNSTAEATGNVSSTHLGNPGGNAGGTVGGRAGALLPADDDEATHVLADRMLVDRESEWVHYEGHVRAWHGDDVLESPSLDIDGRARHIRAVAGVVTSDLQPAVARPDRAGKLDRPNPSAATQPVTIRADSLEYFDSEREARYRGHVRMQAEGAALESDAVDVFFSPAKAGAARIERAVARGHVVVSEPQRRATATQAEYFAAAGKVVLTGGPPTIDDAVNGFATGERLTWFIHEGNLVVDGGAQSPALAKHRIAK